MFPQVLMINFKSSDFQFCLPLIIFVNLFLQFSNIGSLLFFNRFLMFHDLVNDFPILFFNILNDIDEIAFVFSSHHVAIEIILQICLL